MKPDPEMIDDDNPEWTEATARRSVKLDKLPGNVQAVLRKGRGPQKSPVKQRVTIRMSARVVEAFRSTGEGWQVRIDLALQDWLRDHSPADVS